MILSLHRVQVRLTSTSTAVINGWQQLFPGWLKSDAPGANLHLQLTLAEQLPALPAADPIFVDEPTEQADIGLISVYALDHGRVLLHYHDGAMVTLSRTPMAETAKIQGSITPAALQHGRLEDITFTSLAPGLRRSGLYLVHAFAASKNGRALLIVGRTGSGKTTTGLNLLFAGWQLLANDVILLETRERDVFALPTPGGINIRPETFAHLPKLQRLLPPQAAPETDVALATHHLIQGNWSAPARIDWVCFPHIEPRPSTQLSPQNRAVALVRLMEESVDRWDGTALPQHINLLENLCRQTAVYDLQLGQDFTELPALLEEELL